MLCIDDVYTHTIMIQKSKFICRLVPIHDLNLVSVFLEDIKIEYPGATHYCYAYIYNGYKRCSDDGEPSGTAGMPILNILEKKELDHVLCVVVRYFGGIKLGAGGLVRAYANSVLETIEHSVIQDMIEGYVLRISYPYQDTKMVEYLLKNYSVYDKVYGDMVFCNVLISKEGVDAFKEMLPGSVSVEIIKDTYVVRPL